MRLKQTDLERVSYDSLHRLQVRGIESYPEAL